MKINQTELAKALGLSTRRVRELEKDPGLFSSRTGAGSGTRYILSECVNDYINYKIDIATSGSENSDYLKEKIMHERAKRKITELQLSAYRRETFDAADVEEVWANLIMSFKTQLDALPFKIASEIVGESDLYKISQIIEKEKNHLLVELSSFTVEDIKSKLPEEYLEDETSDEEPEATKSVPVGAKNNKASKPAEKSNRKPMGRRK